MAGALALAGPAFAFDCIRVSFSRQGLVRSTGNSGNWTLFDFGSPSALEATLSGFGVTFQPDQADGFGVIAWRTRT